MNVSAQVQLPLAFRKIGNIRRFAALLVYLRRDSSIVVEVLCVGFPGDLAQPAPFNT